MGRGVLKEKFSFIFYKTSLAPWHTTPELVLAIVPTALCSPPHAKIIFRWSLYFTAFPSIDSKHNVFIGLILARELPWTHAKFGKCHERHIRSKYMNSLNTILAWSARGGLHDRRLGSCVILSHLTLYYGIALMKTVDEVS